MVERRKHCMVAYNILSEIERVKPFPDVIKNMPQDTVKELFDKLNVVMSSEYFKYLPSTCDIIMSSGVEYLWSKLETQIIYEGLWNEVKDF